MTETPEPTSAETYEKVELTEDEQALVKALLQSWQDGYNAGRIDAISAVMDEFPETAAVLSIVRERLAEVRA